MRAPPGVLAPVFSCFVRVGFEGTLGVCGVAASGHVQMCWSLARECVTACTFDNLGCPVWRRLTSEALRVAVEVMDATDTSFPAHSFDAIIDKSTIDCLFCCTHPTHPPARMLMAECYRLLRPRCPLLLVSLNKPRKVRCGTYECVVVC